MKIGIVCYPTFGGSGVLATELGHALAKEGHGVHFITYDQPVRLDLLEPNIYYHEVNVHDYPLFDYQPYELALSSQMVETVVAHNLELLHVHYAIPHAYAAYMAKQILKDRGIDIPIITTLHGTDITLVGKNPSYRPAVKFSIEHSDIVTSVSESLRSDTIQFFNVSKKIHVIPNFIDLSLYDGEGCDKGQIADEGCCIVTHISNFRPLKRTKDVIKIFHGIRQKVNSRLILIGDGPERNKALDLAKSLGLEHDVRYLGRTSEVERILCMSDLFLLPSASESFGLAALEAMVARVPVISTNSGGLPEVNIDGETGFLCNVGDVTSMADHAIDILTNTELRVKMKKAARRHAESFKLSDILPQYEALYEQAIGHKL
jgi:N-acetyl-alpha-D-glucosaminyl L-malate synthase BshA